LHLAIFGPSGNAKLPIEPGVASAKVKAAHRYHGILLSYEDETGFYFYRNKKRCKLFTSAFLKRYERKK